MREAPSEEVVIEVTVLNHRPRVLQVVLVIDYVGRSRRHEEGQHETGRILKMSYFCIKQLHFGSTGTASHLKIEMPSCIFLKYDRWRFFPYPQIGWVLSRLFVLVD